MFHTRKMKTYVVALVVVMAGAVFARVPDLGRRSQSVSGSGGPGQHDAATKQVVHVDLQRQWNVDFYLRRRFFHVKSTSVPFATCLA